MNEDRLEDKRFELVIDVLDDTTEQEVQAELERLEFKTDELKTSVTSVEELPETVNRKAGSPLGPRIFLMLTRGRPYYLLTS